MMAAGIDGGDFWLPADFPADDLTADRRLKESDDGDYLADLTRRMALAFLHDDEAPHPKVQSMARSPQSTLCDYRIWNKGSSALTSPPSQLSSPPAASVEHSHDDAWDLLTAAAGQVVRLRLAEEARRQKFNERGLLTPPAKISAPIAAPPKRSAGTGVYYSPLLAQQQLQVERFYQLKQQQALKHQISLAASRQQIRSGNRTGVMPTSAPHRQPAPAPLMHHSRPGVGTRPVFLTAHGTPRESTGTGVFLPRRPENPSDLRKKPVCPPVRSIPSPKLNGDDMRSQPRVLGDFLDPESLVARGNRFILQPHQQQNRYQHHTPAPAMADHDKLRLPAEWTY